MREEAKANEDADRQAKENVDKLNTADSLIFQTEKQLKEFGDKLPADKKAPIEKALADLKDAHAKKDMGAIERATAEMNKVWQAASEDMYKAGQGAGQQPGQPTEGATADAKGGKDDGEVTDVDFEEVK